MLKIVVLSRPVTQKRLEFATASILSRSNSRTPSAASLFEENPWSTSDNNEGQSLAYVSQTRSAQSIHFDFSLMCAIFRSWNALHTAAKKLRSSLRIRTSIVDVVSDSRPADRSIELSLRISIP